MGWKSGEDDCGDCRNSNCLLMRQAGTWNPLLWRCSAFTWTDVSLSKKIQRNYKGLKITVCMRNWGKFSIKDTKRLKNTEATSEELEAKQGYCACSLHTASQRGGQNTGATPFTLPLDAPLPSPHVRNQLTWTPGASNKETCYLFSLLPGAAGAQTKPCLNFLSGL